MDFSRYTVFILIFTLTSLISCKSDDSSDGVDDPRAENLKALGRSAEDILSDDIYSSLIVELVYTSAYPPKQETIDRFRNLLNERINKPGGITFVENVISIPLDASYSLEEIKDIEEEYRSLYTTDDRIALYIFFANAKAESDTPTIKTLGTAYRNTSMVIYEKTLQLVSESQNIDLGLLESATLHHEFGHILALVNLTNDDIHQDHEDLANPNHCRVEECLMFYASNFARNIKSLGFVPDFDPLCIADLQAKGGK
jgi:hypothetical protein